MSQQHYIFGHIALRGVFRSDPHIFFEIMRRDGARFLEYLWKKAGEQAKENVAVSSLEFRQEFVERDGATLLVVTLPEPEKVAEAFMVGCYHKDARLLGVLGKPVMRYFTLEKGMPLDDAPRTVFCEWSDEAHCNLGDGPPATSHAFAERVFEHVA